MLRIRGDLMLLRYPQKMCLRTGTTSCAFATIAQTVCKGAPPKRVIRTQRSNPTTPKEDAFCIYDFWRFYEEFEFRAQSPKLEYGNTSINPSLRTLHLHGAMLGTSINPPCAYHSTDQASHRQGSPLHFELNSWSMICWLWR